MSKCHCSKEFCTYNTTVNGKKYNLIYYKLLARINTVILIRRGESTTCLEVLIVQENIIHYWLSNSQLFHIQQKGKCCVMHAIINDDDEDDDDVNDDYIKLENVVARVRKALPGDTTLLSLLFMCWKNK